MSKRKVSKKILSEKLGIPYETLIKMNDAEIEKCIKQKLKRPTVGPYPIVEMDEVDAWIDRKLGITKDDDIER